MDKGQLDWHRLFGLILTDFFSGSPFHVELERDLCLKKQLLDVIILRRDEGVFHERLPDGLDNLARFNLITFKSYREPLDDWALKELTGHYVNYRKQVSPPRAEYLPEDQFRLFAVCARYPHNLAALARLETVQQGVYDCRRGTDVIRVVVMGELPETDNNAALHLFTAAQELVRYGIDHYRPRSDETSTLITRLFSQYRKEGVPMSYTMADFRRAYALEHLKDLTPEEIRASVPLERLLAGLSSEELLQGLSKEQIAELLKKYQEKQPPPEVK
jgi:hypothetical protein